MARPSAGPWRPLRRALLLAGFAAGAAGPAAAQGTAPAQGVTQPMDQPSPQSQPANPGTQHITDGEPRPDEGTGATSTAPSTTANTPLPPPAEGGGDRSGKQD